MVKISCIKRIKIENIWQMLRFAKITNAFFSGEPVPVFSHHTNAREANLIYSNFFNIVVNKFPASVIFKTVINSFKQKYCLTKCF